MERKDLPNPRIAAILSFVFNGLGQIYNGEIKKGLTLIFLSGISLLILIIGAIFIFYFIKETPSYQFFNMGCYPFLFWFNRNDNNWNL
jgi:TM2 domain-containing membrane protein YozV